jgi:hypothetical protein
MKLPTTIPFCDKTTSRRYRFNLRQAAIIRYRLTLWVTSSISILIAQAFMSSVLAASFRSIATASTSPKSQLSSITSSSVILAAESLFINQQTQLDLDSSSSFLHQQPSYPERIAASGGSASALNNRGLDRMKQGAYASSPNSLYSSLTD